MFLRAFATLFVTFWRGRSGVDRATAKTRARLAFVVSHPCLKNKGTARMGHPAFDAGDGGAVEFSDIFLHGVCSPAD